MGRKKRKMLCEPPPNGFYMVDWSLNELIRRAALSEHALKLWLALKGLAWELGRCDPTDEALGEWLGGVSPSTVRRARAELKGLHLLMEHTDDEGRWLTPLPLLRGMAGKLPEPLRLQALAEEAQLCALLEGEKQANSIRLSLKEVKEVNLTPYGAELDGEEEDPAPPAEPDEAAREAVAAFLRARGVYTTVAARLAGDLLIGRSVRQAQVWALALLLEAREGAQSDGHVVGRWVKRLARGEAPERASLARAREDVEGILSGATAGSAVEGREDVRREDDEALVTDHVSRFTPHSPPPPLPTLTVMPGQGARELPLDAAWDLALGQLRLQMAQATWRAWLEGSRAVGLEDDRLVVEVGSAQAVAWLEARLAPVVLRTLAALTGRALGVRWVVGRQRIRNE